jgi:hypothetical protein
MGLYWYIDIYFKDEGYLLKAHNKFIKEIKNKFEIKIENGKEWIEIVTTTKDKNILNYQNYQNYLKNFKIKI